MAAVVDSCLHRLITWDNTPFSTAIQEQICLSVGEEKLSAFKHPAMMIVINGILGSQIPCLIMVISPMTKCNSILLLGF